jgi:hypothetical protein
MGSTIRPLAVVGRPCASTVRYTSLKLRTP